MKPKVIYTLNSDNQKVVEVFDPHHGYSRFTGEHPPEWLILAKLRELRAAMK